MRVLVRAVGVRDGREVDDRVGRDLGQRLRQVVVLAGVEAVQGDPGLAQQVEPLEQDADVQVAPPGLAVERRVVPEVVDGEAVEHVYVRALLLEREREVVTDEPGPADQCDTALREIRRD